jgi:hypothetical protein
MSLFSLAYDDGMGEYVGLVDEVMVRWLSVEACVCVCVCGGVGWLG